MAHELIVRVVECADASDVGEARGKRAEHLRGVRACAVRVGTKGAWSLTARGEEREEADAGDVPGVERERQSRQG